MSRIYIINSSSTNSNNEPQVYFWRIEIRSRNEIFCHEPAYTPYKIDRSMAAFIIDGARQAKSIERGQ